MHKLDFGVDELIEFKNQTTFPWLLSNVIDNISENLLAEGVEKITMQWGGKKVSSILLSISTLSFIVFCHKVCEPY